MASARQAGDVGAGLIAALLGLGITELTDVAAGVINPLVLRSAAGGGAFEAATLADVLGLRMRLFGVTSPVGGVRIARGGGGSAIRHTFQAPGRVVTWIVWQLEPA